jgi:hypothetical protein
MIGERFETSNTSFDNLNYQQKTYLSEIQYALEAVEDINDELIETMETEEIDFMSNDYLLTINSDSFNIRINFMGQKIWLNSDDEREIIDDEFEPLETFLKRKCYTIINDLQKLSNVMCNR